MTRPTRPRDYPTSRGAAAIGSRLRRLSERIDRDVVQIYAKLGIKFEPRWFGILNQLDLHGTMSVGEISAVLGITHVSVSQTRASLAKRALITWTIDPGDGRVRQLKLTPDGRALVRRLRPLWNALERVAIDLEAEAGRVIPALNRLDRTLDRASLVERAMKAVAKSNK